MRSLAFSKFNRVGLSESVILVHRMRLVRGLERNGVGSLRMTIPTTLATNWRTWPVKLSLKRERVAELSQKFFGTFHVYNLVYETSGIGSFLQDLLRLIADLHVDIECESIRCTQDEEVRNDAY